MRLLTLLLLCVSFNAHAIPEKYSIFFYGPGLVNQGWFTIGEEKSPGLFQITWMTANVGLCPPDPNDLDAEYNCRVNIAGEGTYQGQATFNPTTGAFDDGFGFPTITLQSTGFGHGFVQIFSPDEEGIAYWQGNKASGTYDIVTFGAVPDGFIPEPSVLALLPLAWLAWRAQRRA